MYLPSESSEEIIVSTGFIGCGVSGSLVGDMGAFSHEARDSANIIVARKQNFFMGKS